MIRSRQLNRISRSLPLFITLGTLAACVEKQSRNSSQGDSSSPALPSPPISSPATRTGNPGTALAVDVLVKSLIVRGDTVGITYVLHNRPESRDSLINFAVDAPAGVTKIPTPQPKTDWWVSPTFQGKDIAYWASLGTLPPSTTSIPLYFESVGIPGIVTAWVVGNFPVPEGETDDSTSQNSLRDNAVIGKTVGVEKFRSARTSEALLTRLRSLTQSSCASPLRWITDSNLCSQLLADLDQAEAHRSKGQTARARETLVHYQGLVSAGNTSGTVTSPAYWLLKSNAEIVSSIL